MELIEKLENLCKEKKAGFGLSKNTTSGSCLHKWFLEIEIYLEKEDLFEVLFEESGKDLKELLEDGIEKLKGWRNEN